MSEQLSLPSAPSPEEVDWDAAFSDHYGAMPHPLNPDLTVKDFPTAVRLATASKFGGGKGEEGHASPMEAGLFWKEFQGLEMAPGDYMETLDKLKHLSWRYHDRPPAMSEIKNLSQSSPADIRRYYADLPHPRVPDLSAGEYMKMHTVASHWVQEHLGDKRTAPYDHEVALFHHAGYGPQAISDHYQAMKEPDDTEEEPSVT
jgi:hypothetical protein